MAKFKVGQKVQALETRRVPVAWVGARGVVAGVMETAAGESAAPPKDWEPCYAVLFDGRQDWVAVRESWLMG